MAAIYVICSRHPQCEGPGVCEYDAKEYTQRAAVQDHACGFCSVDSRVPMRLATDEEIAAHCAAHEEVEATNG